MRPDSQKTINRAKAPRSREEKIYPEEAPPGPARDRPGREQKTESVAKNAIPEGKVDFHPLKRLAHFFARVHEFCHPSRDEKN